MKFYPLRTRKGKKRKKILSLVPQATMTKTHLRIPVSMVTREVGAEGAKAGGSLALTLILPLTLLPIPS